jgi:seryl-tRNA synthetase
LTLGKQIKELKLLVDLAQEAFDKLLLCCPNFIHEAVPVGNKESNQVVRSWGNKPDFAFEPKNHVLLNQSLGWFDFQIGAQIAESGFIFYNELGTKLIYALTRLMLRHNKKWGFTPVLPPYVVSQQSLWRNGSLPKFAGDYYNLTEDGLSLTPTAEVCLTNLHADKVYSQEDLPLRNCAWTSCFRREAGGYGANERGLIRIHQFEKVELYSVCDPERSSMELERMVACAEEFLQILGLPHQISLLAAQDCSFVSNKTYDVEVWLPGQNKFYEVSSCSNCTDFQARRAKIRFKRTGTSKPEFVHTLNASSLALPRLIVALMENFQTATGEVILPKVLADEMDLLW